jgi:hypothetical protein
MGVEYDLISDATREGYELGKGPWYELPEALRSSDPEAAIIKLLITDGYNFDLPYATEVAREVVAFAVAHPDWRIIDDCSSDISVMTDEERAETLAEEIAEGLIADEKDDVLPIYRRVGTRYRRSGR